MPHTNRKKKTSSSTTTRTSKPTIVHTKRQEILDEEGWIHVVDTPRKRSATLTKAANGGLHAGDFEIDGVGYVQRTVEEMTRECEFWGKGWVESKSCRKLGALLREEMDAEVEEEKEEEVVGGEEIVDGGVGGVELEAQTAQEEENKTAEEPKPKESTLEGAEEIKPTESNPETADIKLELTENIPEEALPQEETTPTIPQPPTQRRNVDNIIVLGLGSLQSARREGRRATLTQLAALQTIIKHFGMLSTSLTNTQLTIYLESQPSTTHPLKITLQEPLFTPTDKTYLSSIPNYEIVNDPEAFTKITEGSLVYAIHCYAQVYKAISEGVRPAVLIGTDVGNFGRFNLCVLPPLLIYTFVNF